MTGKTETLTLKWGTLKAWKLNPGGPAAAAIERFYEDGVALGAAQQHNTDTQKQAILDIIDALDNDEIYLSWDGIYVDKEAAKKYVMEYDN